MNDAYKLVQLIHSDYFCMLQTLSLLCRSFLKDLVETTHLFLKMLEKMAKGSSNFVVQKKKAKRKKKTKPKGALWTACSHLISWWIYKNIFNLFIWINYILCYNSCFFPDISCTWPAKGAYSWGTGGQMGWHFWRVVLLDTGKRGTAYRCRSIWCGIRSRYWPSKVTPCACRWNQTL